MVEGVVSKAGAMWVVSDTRVIGVMWPRVLSLMILRERRSLDERMRKRCWISQEGKGIVVFDVW